MTAPTSAMRRTLGRVLEAVVDPTIVLAFARTGFAVHALRFCPDDLDVDLAGRRCLVTGANSGIGFELARGLAERGAAVGLLCRARDRGEAALRRIRETTGNLQAWLEVVDVADMAAVRAAGARLAADGVDVLIHNAGTLPAQRETTRDGLELTFAAHVVGPHVLTRLLCPALERSPDGRVVWVSSGGMYAKRLTLDDPGWEARPYDGVTAYAETKRAQVVLAELWAARLRESGVLVNAMHPGWADTPGVRTSLPRFFGVMRALLRSPAEGADTALWLAVAPRTRLESGRFYFDRAPRRTHLLPFTRESEDERRRLWALCERWVEQAPATEARA